MWYWIGAKPISCDFSKQFKPHVSYSWKWIHRVFSLKELLYYHFLIEFYFLWTLLVQLFFKSFNGCKNCISKNHLTATNHAAPPLIWNEYFAFVCWFANCFKRKVFTVSKKKYLFKIFKELIFVFFFINSSLHKKYIMIINLLIVDVWVITEEIWRMINFVF